MMRAPAAIALVALLSGAAAAQDVIPGGGPRTVDLDARARDRLVDESRVHVARLRYAGGGDWYGDPSSLANLQREFEARTGIPTARGEFVVEPSDPELFAHPFLYMTGHGNVRFAPDEIEALREHLLGGAFLWADDCYGMDASFRAAMRELFPERELVLVPLDHAIYRSFYELGGPPKIHEHDGKPPQGWGIFDGGRLMVFYTYESDVGDGLEDPDVHDDPSDKREQAIQMAVNVLYYAITNRLEGATGGTAGTRSGG